jgi:ketosteroid isomerase-like protein
MGTKKSGLVVILCLLAVFGRSAQRNESPQPSVTLPPELARVLTDYEDAWKNKDSVGLSHLFAEDGFVLSPGNPMVHGQSAIEQFYRGSGGPLSLRAVAFATEGNVGYIVGGFSGRPEIPDTGKFTLTLRRDAAGRWLIVSDMDNGNAPRKPGA